MQLKNPTISEEMTKRHIRQLMITMKRTRPPQSASDLKEKRNDTLNFAPDAADTSAAANGVSESEEWECVFNDTVTNTVEKVAADDYLEDPSNNRCSKQVAKALHPKSDGETGESAQQPSRGLIYLMSSQYQIKIGSCIDIDSALYTLPDMTNLADR